MSDVRQSLRVGVRSLLKQPSFTVAAVLTLALGIGTTTAMFSIVYGVVLRPLPFDEPDRLVRLWTAWKPALGRGAVSAANARDWRARNHVFEDVALVQSNRSFNFVDRGDPERLLGARVSASVFPILRATPLFGRPFADSENEIGQDDVVMLSHALWARRFGGDPSIVGRVVQLNGVPMTVVGVMKPDFRYPSRETELWVPLSVPAPEYLQRTAGSYSAIARLKPGVTLDRARADLRRVSASLAREYPATNERIEVGMAPLRDDMVGAVRQPLYILFGAVGAMLLIGCANLTNLLLARGVARRRELAIRTALGASRGRLAEASLTELVPLLALGGALGLLTATGAIRALVPLLPVDIPRVEEIGISLPVLGFSTAVVIAVALLVGLWPAIVAARTRPSESLGDVSRGATSARGGTRARDLLVIGQIAATLLLLVGATVLMRSFLAVRQVTPGFDPARVLSTHIAIPSSQYPSDTQVVAFYARALDRIQALPGVDAVGMVNRLPLGRGNQTGGVQIDGADGDWPSVETRTASPDYFRALGIPIREGRTFLSSDGMDAPMVAIVDERLARTVWPGRSPIGQRLREGVGSPWSTVVGVVGHVRHTSLDEDSPPQVYWNHPQRPSDRMALVVKALGDPATLTRAVAAAVRSVDPQQALYDTRTLDVVVDRSLGNRRFQMVLLAVFATIALVLAGIGAYGVIAYGVTQRVREFGVRMALGARRRDVIALVLRRGGLLFTLGAAAGLALATLGVDLLSSLVYGVAPRDVPSFLVATLVLFVVSMAACFVPARRAAGVDPSIALRGE